MKWKKKAKKALIAVGGKLKLKKLQKQLLQECNMPSAERTAMLDDLTMQLTSSKQFRITGSCIALAE